MWLNNKVLVMQVLSKREKINYSSNIKINPPSFMSKFCCYLFMTKIRLLEAYKLVHKMIPKFSTIDHKIIPFFKREKSTNISNHFHVFHAKNNVLQ